MTLEELPGALEQFKNDLLEHMRKEASDLALRALQPHYLVRIFEQGLASDGSVIGYYSSAAAYFSKEQFVQKGKFRPQGKTGEKKFFKGVKAGQDHRAMYLKGGYKELRDIQGRPTDKKNYSYTTSLRFSINVVQYEGRSVLAITDNKESIKRKALEKQDKKNVFGATDDEVKIVVEELNEQKKIFFDRVKA